LIKRLFFILILSITINAFSQKGTKYSIEINYPLPTGENFFGKNYNGFADIGITYTFTQKPLMDFGISFNTSLLNYNFDLQDNQDQLYNYKVNAYVLQPRIYAIFFIATLEKLHPSAGLGYSFIVYKVAGLDPLDFGNENATENQNGINVNLGAAYDLSESIFIKAQYDYIKPNIGNGISNKPYNTNIHLMKIGLGIRF